MSGGQVIEHGSTSSGRWLRERRLRITLWIAAAEGLLYLAHVLHWWQAVTLAVVGVGLFWLARRTNRSAFVQDLTWILAASQLLVLCVPIALSIVEAFAIGIIAVLAIVGLVLLFTRKPA